MRLLSQAMAVVDYTTSVDQTQFVDAPSKTRAKRLHQQIKEVCGILTGLVISSDFKVGQRLLQDNEFNRHPGWFQMLFEIIRRHKVRNPEKLRTEYGKLVYLLMDAMAPNVRELLGFSKFFR